MLPTALMRNTTLSRQGQEKFRLIVWDKMETKGERKYCEVQ